MKNLDILPIVAFSEASAEADYWRKRSLMHAALRHKAEQETEELRTTIASLKDKNDGHK